ncbi:MAG: RNA polymerase sigma factor [Candidatus Brocadiae bacterium]|nr:RNA polymerase sigma factor [Candidatus Brocadiia bacterium]
MNSEEIEGEKLALLLKEGKKEVFFSLSQIYEKKIYRAVSAYLRSESDTEDIVQETMIQLLKKIDQWQGKNFDAWLLKIAKNLALDFLRKKNSFRYSLPLDIDVGDQSLPCHDVLEKEEKRVQMNKILSELPKNQKEILYLKHFHGYKIHEIALRLGCSEGTVKATLFQTFQKLKDRFQTSGLME